MTAFTSVEPQVSEIIFQPQVSEIIFQPQVSEIIFRRKMISDTSLFLEIRYQRLFSVTKSVADTKNTNTRDN